MFTRKNIEEINPRLTTKYDISWYSRFLSVMTEKMISPVPRTKKFAMKVNRFRRLLSLSWIEKWILFASSSKSEMAPDSCGLSAMRPNRCWTDPGRMCRTSTQILGYPYLCSRWTKGWSMPPPISGLRHTTAFFDLCLIWYYQILWNIYQKIAQPKESQCHRRFGLTEERWEQHPYPRLSSGNKTDSWTNMLPPNHWWSGRLRTPKSSVYPTHRIDFRWPRLFMWAIN